jgi:hypothetical protein
MDADLMTVTMPATKTAKPTKKANDDRKAHVAALTGKEVSAIRTVKLELDTLRKQGLLIDLSISGRSMFTRAATWVELGIMPDEDDPRTSTFTKGQKFLIPEAQIKKLASIEASMRQNLDAHSYNVTGFRPYRWLPFTAYEAWKARHMELTERFDKVRAEIIEHYDEYRVQLASHFARVAEASFSDLQKQGYDWIIIAKRPYSKEEFIQMVVNDAVNKMPTVQAVENDLKADYITALVYGQEDIERDSLRAAKLQSQRDIEFQKKREAEYLSFEKIRAEQEAVRHQTELNRLEEEEREVKITAMWKAEMEHAKSQLNEIASPFTEVFTALRNQFAEDAAKMLESIQKNGFVKGKVAEKGRGLIDLFELLAVQDDFELKNRLMALRTAIGVDGKRKGAEPERSTEDVKAILEEIMELSHNAVSDLTRGPSRFSFVE